jgi:hypothetical protein
MPLKVIQHHYTVYNDHLFHEDVKITKWQTKFQHEVGFDAFPVTEYDEVLSGYQLGQMVER